MGLVEKAGHVADGSTFVEKTIVRYRGNVIEVCEIRFKNHDKQIDQGLLITLEEFPFLQFRTTAPDQDGLFFFTSLHYIGGTYSGWNEWSQELVGSGSFRISGNVAYMNISSLIETGTFISAKILHNGSKHTGEEAIVSIRARAGRITALIEWMYAFSSNQRFSDIKTFKAYWKPIFFPELVNAEQRPSDYIDTDVEWVQVEDIKWNTAYTREIFPEELRPVRDSGALLRDFEEASAWLYCVYEWQNIKAVLKENNLVKR
ncbi:MAG: hypothetical protein LBP19_08775 [Treponema sp.]|nr:hypothetical protein [Treponema sp.]